MFIFSFNKVFNQYVFITLQGNSAKGRNKSSSFGVYFLYPLI